MTIRWRKSTYSGGGGQTDCVELASSLDRIRDSKNPDGPILSTVDISSLVSTVKAGRFTLR